MCRFWVMLLPLLLRLLLLVLLLRSVHPVGALYSHTVSLSLSFAWCLFYSTHFFLSLHIHSGLYTFDFVCSIVVWMSLFRARLHNMSLWWLLLLLPLLTPPSLSSFFEMSIWMADCHLPNLLVWNCCACLRSISTIRLAWLDSTVHALHSITHSPELVNRESDILRAGFSFMTHICVCVCCHWVSLSLSITSLFLCSIFV